MDVASARRDGVELREELDVIAVGDMPDSCDGDCSGISSEPMHIAWGSPALLILRRHSSPLDLSLITGSSTADVRIGRAFETVALEKVIRKMSVEYIKNFDFI
jgi:hypothetical protein